MSKKMDNFCLVSSFLLVFFAFFVFVNTARNIFFAVITSKEGIFRYVHRTPVAPFRTLGPAQCERCGCARHTKYSHGAWQPFLSLARFC